MSGYISPLDQLIHCTVRILCEDFFGKKSSGTGYIYQFEDDGIFYPCVVTNKHVVRNAKIGVFNLTLRDSNGLADLGNHESIVLNDLGRFLINHPDENIDLVAIPIGSIINNALNIGKNYYYISLDKNLVATDDLLETLSSMEEIVMIGYPNGIWDELHNLPIIRKGITATHAKLSLNGKPEFLIDAACFPGSSGSPVFLANIGGYTSGSNIVLGGTRIALLGTLYAAPQHTTTGEIIIVEVPTDTKSISLGAIPNNLGYVIHVRELLILEESVLNALRPKPNISRNSKCYCGSDKRYKECCGNLA